MLPENKCLSHKSHFRWDRGMLQYAVIADLIQFALHLVQISDFAIRKSLQHHNRTSSMLYGWCDTASCCSFTNSSPHIDPPIWLKDFKLWFFSPKSFIKLLYCLVFVGVGPLEPLLCFLNSNSTIYASFTESSPYSGCWHIFSGHWFSCSEVLGAVSLLSRKLVTVMKL